jgi:hypothetical protein
MSKRKLPGIAAATQAEVNDENLTTDIHQPSDNLGDTAPVLQPLAVRTSNGDNNKRAAIDLVAAGSVPLQAPITHNANQNQVAPSIHSAAAAVAAAEPEHPAIAMSRAQDPDQAVQQRVAPKGSPASEFMLASPNRTLDLANLTCDLRAIPRDRWNKRRSLSAVVIAVFAIQSKAATVRRNVVIRDEIAECVVTVWGNHTNVLNEAIIGRPITLLRVCLTEYEGKIQIAMPKDSSISIGNTPATAPIMLWMQRAGSNMLTVQQVRCEQIVNCLSITDCFVQAIAGEATSVIGLHGILAKVDQEDVSCCESQLCR